MRKILIKIYYNLCLILSPRKKNLNILKGEELIDYVIKNKLSIIRYGDGEFMFFTKHKSPIYQKYDENLKNNLKDIYYNYSNSEKYILCVPGFYTESRKWFKSILPIYTYCHAEWRLFFRKTRKKDAKYGDAFIFSDANIDYKKLWEKDGNIILVHNDRKWADAFEKRMGTKVIFIKAPTIDAYGKIDEIEKKIRAKNGNKKIKILISAGPAAKVLVKRLSNDGFIVYDTGHFLDKPLKAPKSDKI